MAENPRRRADCCEVYDDHPRHVVVDPTTGAEQLMHMDCCAERNGCAVCRQVLASAYSVVGEGATGDDLREALIEMPPLQIEHYTGSAHSEIEVRRG